MSELNTIALKILEKGKGILAADESNGTMTKRLNSVNVPSTPEENVGAAPALPEPTMSAAEEMFGGGAIRQIAAGAGKFKK